MKLTYYQCRNGNQIYRHLLDAMEGQSYSEKQIAKYYNISRMQLYRIREEMGWKQQVRSDKGGKHEHGGN